MTWNKDKDIFALMVGHGKSLNGTWDSGCTYGNYTEAGLMLPIVQVAAKWLRKSGVRVITDADQNNNRNMISCVSWANSEGAKYYMSVHCDYTGASKGVAPLYVSSAGKTMATTIGKSIATQLNMTWKGAFKRSDLYELNASNMVATILETGCISKDLNYLKDSNSYGKALARAICSFIGVTFAQSDTFTVKFKSRGGEGKMTSVKVKVGAKVKLPANTFTRDGFKFMGWSKGKSDVITLKKFQIGKVKYKNKAKVKFGAKAGQTVTLYACWKGIGAEAAARWARLIAANNSFTYGTGSRSHHNGCYFCGTNRTGVKKANKGSAWDKTYCCNPFVWAAFVHGANISSKCKDSGLSLEWWLKQKFNGKKMFKKLGYNVRYSDLHAGDILLKPNKHVKIFVGTVNGKMYESQAKREGFDKGSICTNKVSGRIGEEYIALKCVLKR